MVRSFADTGHEGYPKQLSGGQQAANSGLREVLYLTLAYY